MRRIAALLMLGVLAEAATATIQTEPRLGLREAEPQPVAFTHAKVFVAPGRVAPDATLLVRDGRVAAVGAEVQVPATATVYDLAGAAVYPGFLDPYTEYGLAAVGRLNPEAPPGGGPKPAGDRAGADSWNDAVHAERAWADAFVPDAEAAEKLLAKGFTAVQSVKKDGIFRGRGFVASLAPGGLANELLLAPRTGHFLSFDKGTSAQDYPSSLMGSIALVRQTLLDARWYAAARQAGDAGEGSGELEVNRALAALADLGATVLFDAADEQSLLRAARIGDELDLALAYVGSGREYRVLEAVAALGAPLVLPASLPEKPKVASLEEALDADLVTLRHWERAPGNPAALARAGVRFAFSAHGLREGEDFWANVRDAVAEGLPEETALAALTTVPAELAGVADLVGTLEPGKRADFVIAAGSPFLEEDVLREVWIGGELAHEIAPRSPVDFAGDYLLVVQGTEQRLHVGGRPAKPEGKLTVGETSVELANVAAAADRLSFTAALPDGVVRVTLRRLGDAVVARMALPDGSVETATLAPAPPEAPAEAKAEAGEGEGEEETSEAAEAMVSRLTFPFAPFGAVAPPEPEDVLVRGATIWTGEAAGVLRDADLLVRGGRIAAVGVGLEPPAGVRVIDAAGKHVTAGMIDEHSHIAITDGVNEPTHAVTAEVRIGDIVNPNDVAIYRALAGGTTTAQLLHGSANPIGGQAQVIKLRWGRSAEDLKLAAAPPTIKFALGENVKQSNWGDDFTSRYPQTRMGVEALIRDRFLAARDYAAAWDAWRALPERKRAGTVPPRRDLQLETLAEILAGRRFVHSHSYVQSEILALMRLAEELGFRIQTFTHVLEGYKVAPELARHGAGASSFADWWAYKFEVYDAIPYNTCLLHDAGVVTSINSDSDDLIRRLNTEAGKSVMHCGMDEQDALALATINPARQLRIDDRVGSLAPGKDADFVIWSGHPLSLHSRAEQTWIDGTLYFDRERDAELAAADRAEREALIQKLLQVEEEKKDEGAEEGTDAQPGL
jgi:imidazolonepropionase-like amidohydrolase